MSPISLPTSPNMTSHAPSNSAFPFVPTSSEMAQIAPSLEQSSSKSFWQVCLVIRFCAFSRSLTSRSYPAEKALAILNGRPIPYVTPLAYLYLSPFPPTNPPYVPPAPQAQPRLVKHLPLGYTDVALFELFRPYGPLASVCVNQPGFPEPTAFLEFYSEDDARAAEAGLHCTEVVDSTIAVQAYHQPRRPLASPSDFGINPNATSFVPGYQQVSSILYLLPSPIHGLFYFQYSPPHSQYGGYSPSRASPFMHGPGQQVQFAPLHGPGSTSHSGLIDPCNLFCKVTLIIF